MENQITVTLAEVSDRGLDVLVALALGLDVRPSYHTWMRETFISRGMDPVRVDQHVAISGPDHPFVNVNGRCDPLPFYSTVWNDGGLVLDTLSKDESSFRKWASVLQFSFNSDVFKGSSALRQMMLNFVSGRFSLTFEVDASFKDIL